MINHRQISFLLSMMALSTTIDALAPNTNTNAKAKGEAAFVTGGRRQFFGILGSGLVAAAATAAVPSTANAAAAKTGLSSPFTGDYDDPNHPNCLRQVKVVGAPIRGDGSRSAFPVIEVTGYDGGKDGMCSPDAPPSRADLWKVTGKVKSNTEALIDFSPKGGPKDLVAKFDKNGIVFPDGNKWTKLGLPANNRRPKDMSTLSDGVKG